MIKKLTRPVSNHRIAVIHHSLPIQNHSFGFIHHSQDPSGMEFPNLLKIKTTLLNRKQEHKNGSLYLTGKGLVRLLQ